MIHGSFPRPKARWRDDVEINSAFGVQVDIDRRYLLYLSTATTGIVQWDWGVGRTVLNGWSGNGLNGRSVASVLGSLRARVRLLAGRGVLLHGTVLEPWVLADVLV